MRLQAFLCLLFAQSWGLTAILKSVYDGDTLKVDIEDKEGCIPEVFSKDLGVRVMGIDTPEIRAQCRLEKCLALKAKAFTESKLSEAEILFENEERDKYFRILADVRYKSKGTTQWKTLSDELIKAGLGVAYFGSTKSENWCDFSPNTVFYQHTLACISSDICVDEEYQTGSVLTTEQCKQLTKAYGL
jgi:endonuclease YncB( thermonuclease family)